MSEDLTLSVLFPSEYLKCEDLKGRNVTVQIANVSVDQVPITGGKKDRKCVLRLAKTAKKVIVGKTNGYALGVLLGPNGRNWIGHRVTLCPDEDTFGREVVPCIRIAGSPDAPPERAQAYARAWRGERMGGALCSRLKRALARLETAGTAPPVEAIEPDPEPEQTSYETS